MTQPIGAEEATRAVAANTTARARFIDRLGRYVDGTQYADRPWWFSTEKPLLERAPCIVYPATRNAIASHVSLCIGEGRFPKVTCSPDESDLAMGETLGLTEDQGAALDAFVNGAIASQVRLSSAARQMLRAAMGNRSAAAIVCARAGRLYIDHVQAKNCTPTFKQGGRPTDVESLEIRYVYLESYWDDVRREQGVRAMLYRRVVDAMRDVTYHPIKAREDGEPPKDDLWKEDKSQTVDHNLGRCPVIWYPFLGLSGERGEVDGRAIHEELLDEIDGLNFTLSQRHRAAIYVGDPQIVETGVDETHNPTADGQSVILVDQAENGILFMPKKAWGTQPARRKGAGTVWRYPNETADVKMLTLPGDALKAIDDHAKDLKSKIDESMHAVFLDPGNSALRMGELSGAAIRKLYVRQTSFLDEVRDDFGANCLLPLVDMLLWIVAKLAGNGSEIRIKGLKTVAPILGKFLGANGWSAPELSLVWGDYFTDSAKDELDVVRLAAEAKDAGLIEREHGIQRVAGIFGIKDAHELAEKLDKAEEENVAALHATVHAAKSMADGNDEDMTGDDAED